jgi:hypothetical protein
MRRVVNSTRLPIPIQIGRLFSFRIEFGAVLAEWLVARSVKTITRGDF